MDSWQAIGAIIIIFQMVMTSQLTSIRRELKHSEKDREEIWKRLNGHGHAIDCTDPSCKPKTVGVIPHD